MRGRPEEIGSGPTGLPTAAPKSKLLGVWRRSLKRFCRVIGVAG